MFYTTALKTKIALHIRQFTQSTIVKNFFIFSFGSFLLRGISIFLAPITMNILDPKDYGIIALANSFVSILVVFIGLGLRQAFSIEYFHCDNKQRKIMLTAMITLYLIIATPLFIIFFSFPSLINRLVFVGKAPTILIMLILVYAFIHFFVEFFYQVLTYRGQAFKMTIIQTSVALVVIALDLLFLVWFRLGVISLMAGQVVGLIIVFFIGLQSYFKTACHRHLDTKRYMHSCINYLKLGLPFVPGILCGWILASSDRWVLARYSTMHNVGIYSLASTFGQLFQMLILLPMSRAYIPAIMNKFARNKNNLLAIERWNQKNMIICMVGLAIIISGGYIASKPFLYWILPTRYQPAIGYIWMILMGYIFLLGEHFASIFVIFKKKVYFQAGSILIPSLLNLLLNILLVPSFGVRGCVIATLVSYATYFAIKVSYNLYLQRKHVISDQYNIDKAPSDTL